MTDTRAGALAAAVASELNDELTMILSQCEISLDLLGSGHPAAETLMELRHAALRCAGITHSLLGFTLRNGTPRPARLAQVLSSL